MPRVMRTMLVWVSNKDYSASNAGTREKKRTTATLNLIKLIQVTGLSRVAPFHTEVNQMKATFGDGL